VNPVGVEVLILDMKYATCGVIVAAPVKVSTVLGAPEAVTTWSFGLGGAAEKTVLKGSDIKAPVIVSTPPAIPLADGETKILGTLVASH